MNQKEFEKKFVNKIIHGDCLEFMKDWPDNCVDLVLTDPPYGIDGGRGGTSKLRGKGNYDGRFSDTRQYIETVVMPALSMWRQKADGVVLTCGCRNLDIYPQADSFGCFYQPAGSGMQHWGQVDSQPILYYGRYYRAGKWPRKCSYIMTGRPSCTDHPCSKPLDVWARLLDEICPPNGIVLDPMCGSGTTCVAAKMLGYNYIGIDISKDYCEISRMRLKGLKTGISVTQQKQGFKGLLG